jgi:hypothetical protein
VQAAISRAESDLGLDDSKVHIVGDYSIWFAHPRNFSADLEEDRGDIYLCFTSQLQAGGLSFQNYDCDRLRKRVADRDIARASVLGHELHILSSSSS